MTTPDHSYVINQLATEPYYRELLIQNTTESITEFMQEAGKRLSAHDNEWGYLTAPVSDKHLVLPDGRCVSVDSFCYQATMQAVDVLQNAVEASGEARPQWLLWDKPSTETWTAVGTVSTGGSADAAQDEKIASLERRLAALEGSVVQYGMPIALQAAGGKFLCADGGGPTKDGQEFTLTARSSVAAWESWKTFRGQSGTGGTHG